MPNLNTNPGNIAQFTYTLKNRGETTASGDVDLVFDGDVVATQSQSIEPGQTKTDTIEYEVPAEDNQLGTYNAELDVSMPPEYNEVIDVEIVSATDEYGTGETTVEEIQGIDISSFDGTIRVTASGAGGGGGLADNIDGFADSYGGGNGGFIDVEIDASQIDGLSIWPGTGGKRGGDEDDGLGAGGVGYYDGGDGARRRPFGSGGGGGATTRIADLEGNMIARAEGGGGGYGEDAEDESKIGGGGGSAGGDGGAGGEAAEGTGQGGDGGDYSGDSDGGYVIGDHVITQITTTEGGGASGGAAGKYEGDSPSNGDGGSATIAIPSDN